MVRVTKTRSASRAARHVVCCLLMLALSLVLAGCVDVDAAIDGFINASYNLSEEDTKPSSTLVITGMEEGCRFVFTAFDQLFWDALEVYAQGRVVELNLASREPQHFSGWVAYEDLFATDADPNGKLTLWEDEYYITHDWSPYGQQILAIIPGDTVEINGRTLHVQGVFCYPKEAYDDELRALLGFDTVILQTCEPNTNLNRIVYGGWTES